MRLRPSRFLTQVLALQVSSGVQVVSQAFTTIALALVLGARGQGLYVAAVTLQAVLWSFQNLGAARGVAGQIAAAAARDRIERTTDWIAFVAKVTLMLGLVCLALGWLLLPWLAEVLFGEPAVGRWAAWLCVLPLVELPRNVAAAAFQGTRRMTALARLENGHAVARAYLVVTGAVLGGSPAGAVAGLVGGSVVASILALSMYSEACGDGGYALPGLVALARRVPGVPLLRGARLGLRVALLKNVHVLGGNWIPRLLLGSLTGLEWVAYYHVAERILSIPVLLTQAVSRTLLPALGEIAGERDLVRFRALFRRTTLVAGGCVTVAVAATLALTPLVTRLAFPADYGAPVLLFATILALAGVAQAFALGIDAFFIATNQVRAWYALSFLGIAVALPVYVGLVLHVPVTGTAWGVVVMDAWLFVLVGYAFMYLERTAATSPWGADAPRERPASSERASASSFPK